MKTFLRSPHADKPNQEVTIGPKGISEDVEKYIITILPNVDECYVETIKENKTTKSKLKHFNCHFEYEDK